MTNKEAIDHIKLILLRDRDNELHFVSHDEEIALDLAIKALEERPTGEWKPKRLWDNTHIWVCSECGNQSVHGTTLEKACWKCGAKMKGR